jgi:hypothetical protein
VSACIFAVIVSLYAGSAATFQSVRALPSPSKRQHVYQRWVLAIATRPLLNALPARMSLSSSVWFGEAPTSWIMWWYHFHSSSQFAGTSALPSAFMMLAAPHSVPWALGGATHWWTKPHCSTAERSNAGSVASTPLASTVRNVAISSSLSKSHGPSHSVPAPYVPPHSVGGYGRPASSNRAVL